MFGTPERKKLVPSAKRLPPAGETGQTQPGNRECLWDEEEEEIQN
jgi:hypothetical protein